MTRRLVLPAALALAFLAGCAATVDGPEDGVTRVPCEQRGEPPRDASIGAIRVFARVPDPGRPEGIAILCDQVFVTTDSRGEQEAVFEFDSAGRLRRTVDERDRQPGPPGLLCTALDAHGRLYVIENAPPRVLRYDITLAAPEPALYAEFPAASSPNCMVFAPDGSLYVTDSRNPRLFHVAPGGEVTVWAEGGLLETPPSWQLGLNGIAISPDSRSVYALHGGYRGAGDHPQLAIVALPIEDPGSATAVYTAEGVDAPEALVFGTSGRSYLVLPVARQVVILDGSWNEVARYPDPLSNELQEIPMREPANAVFHDATRSLIIANHPVLTQAFLEQDLGVEEEWYAILSMYVDDTGVPPVRPVGVP